MDSEASWFYSGPALTHRGALGKCFLLFRPVSVRGRGHAAPQGQEGELNSLWPPGIKTLEPLRAPHPCLSCLFQPKLNVTLFNKTLSVINFSPKYLSKEILFTILIQEQ